MTPTSPRSQSQEQSEGFYAFSDIVPLPTQERLHDHDLVEHVRRAVPFDHIAVTGLDIEGFHFGAGAYTRSDFPSASLEAYYAEKMHLVDPLVSSAIGTATPVTEEQAFDGVKNVDRRLLALLRSSGLKNRTVVPLRRSGTTYGAVTVTRSKAFTESELDFLSLIAEPLHRKLTATGMERFSVRHQVLTAGELLCLRYASKGMTSEEIAASTHYKTDTVNSYLKSAPRKLGAANRLEAVAEAIRRRLIE